MAYKPLQVVYLLKMASRRIWPGNLHKQDRFIEGSREGCRCRASLVACPFLSAGAVLALHCSPFALVGRMQSGFVENQMEVTADGRSVGDAKKGKPIQRIFFTLSGKH